MLRTKAVVLIAGTLLSAPLAAQRLQGSEVTVSSMPGVFPRSSQVARAPNGDFVVVWTSRLPSGADRVWMRRVSATGKPTGRESQVAPFAAAGQQDNPQIAVAPGGNFMVAWDMGDQYFHNASFGRCFAANGRTLGPAFPLNPGNQDPIDLHPAVAAAPDGSFVATWASGPTESGALGYNLLARRFAANGRPLGPAFKIVDPTLAYQDHPRVTVNGDGDLLFAWMSNQTASASSPYRLLVRRFDADGHPLGDPLQVAQGGLADISVYTMAAAENGEILFVWISQGISTFPSGILGQLCAADGTQIGGSFVIHTGEQVPSYAPPGVAAIPGGGYFVVWSTYSSNPERIVGKILASDGTAQGDDLAIGAAQLADSPAVVIGHNGAGSVTWTTVTLQPDQGRLLLRRLVF
jgi:hypothetical protein